MRMRPGVALGSLALLCLGVVREVAQQHATVDFNHPLAGHEVVFRVHILDVGLPDASAVQADD